MILSPIAAALLALGAAAWAQAGTAGDLAFDPVLRDIEAKMPAYEAVEATDIRIPTRSIELGPSSPMYRCWNLVLTGDHGKQALGVFERLRSVHSALKDLRGKLAKDLLLYATSRRGDPEMQGRIMTQHQALESLFTSYRQIVQLGERNGLLKASRRGIFSWRRTVAPTLRDDDYTMVYAESDPSCPPRTSGQ
ncbi:MAG: hypothetical protein ABII00_07335 [Elusimicrobiota bacterium]